MCFADAVYYFGLYCRQQWVPLWAPLQPVHQLPLALLQVTEIEVVYAIGAVVGGAMFGDNLSMISDTTIAATNSQESSAS